MRKYFKTTAQLERAKQDAAPIVPNLSTQEGYEREAVRREKLTLSTIQDPQDKTLSNEGVINFASEGIRQYPESGLLYAVIGSIRTIQLLVAQRRSARSPTKKNKGRQAFLERKCAGLFQKALELDPYNPHILARFARYCEKTTLFAHAELGYAFLIGKDFDHLTPDQLTFVLKLGMLYERQNHLALASGCFGKVMDSTTDPALIQTAITRLDNILNQTGREPEPEDWESVEYRLSSIVSYADPGNPESTSVVKQLEI